MGFASQPPLSALGGSGSGAFIPSPSSSGARCEDKPSQTPAALQGLPTPHAPSTASYPTPLEPPHTNPMNARMFNPVATSGAGVQSFQTPTNAISAQVVGPLSASVSSTLVQGSSETPVGPSVSTKSSSTSTSLRGRERYCSGGAWVGPAPGWPKPPPTATIENTDVSQVRSNHLQIVNVLRKKYHEATQSAPASRMKELEGISNKIGGLFVFLNNSGAVEHTENSITEPVVEALIVLVNNLESRNVPGVNSILLFLSQTHWEEVSYWFPALKRLVRFATATASL